MHNRGDCECGCHGHQGHHGHHGHQGHHGHDTESHHGRGGCCCHSGGHFGRHYYSKEEMISRLENYLEQLRAEAKGVEEHLEQLKKTDTKS